MLESTEDMNESESHITVDRFWLNTLVSEFQAEIGALKVQLIAKKADDAIKDKKLAELQQMTDRLSARLEELQSNGATEDSPEPTNDQPDALHETGE
jgi:hypothetical protein